MKSASCVDDFASSSCSEETATIAQAAVMLPADVIGRHIGSFLDRPTMNALRITNREVCSSMMGMYQPWPMARLPVGNTKKLGIQSLVFSPDGSSLACRSRGGTIQVWNRNTGKQIEWPCPGPLCFGNLSFSPDGRILACDGKGKSIRLFDVATGACIQSFQGHQGAITCLAFSTKETQLLASGSTDSTIRLWDRTTNREHATLHGHFGAVYSLDISTDGQFLASGGTDRILYVWNLQKVRDNTPCDFCQELRGHEMTIVDVRFSDRWLVSASLDATVRVWSRNRRSSGPREPKRRAGNLSYSCHQIVRMSGEALCMKVLPHGRQLAVGTTDSKILVWDLDDNNEAEEGEDDTPLSSPPVATFSGKLFSFAPGVMATSSKDGSIQLQEC